MKQKTRMVIYCVGLTFLFGWWFWSIFQIQQNKLCTESSLIFAEVIQKEKTLRIEQVWGNYDPQKSPNKISGVEKQEWCDQDFLFYSDSTRTLLDSLFHATLLERNIKAETAIRCVWENRVIETSSDSAFYKEALPLKLFTYRLNENPDNNIKLQAYIKFPFGTIWQHSYLLWIILGLGVLALSTIIDGYRFWYKKMHEIAKLELQLQQQQQELLEKEKHLSFPESGIQDKTIRWIELSGSLFFNEEHGDLYYKNEENIRLTDNSLKLFCLFIKAEQRKLTYENICLHVLSRSIKNGLSKTDRDATSNTVRHLRTHLKPIHVIGIESIRGIGYQMIISDSLKS